LVVVDDGQRHPVDEVVVASAGGRLIRLNTVTPLGTKLNLGLSAGRGPLCLKMDDDDWYASRFLENMVNAVMARSVRICRPTIAFLAPFFFFDVASWEVHRADARSIPGSTLLFTREDWKERPFRALSSNEDMWFLEDQLKLGISPLPVRDPELFLAVRHSGSRRDRGHSWTHQWYGEALETYLPRRPTYRTPEALLPAWAIAAYRELQRDLLAVSAERLSRLVPPGAHHGAALSP
jgi:glycosyltransferase involved in cell wall biosynthesis